MDSSNLTSLKDSDVSSSHKHDLEQPILHALVHGITLTGFFHAIAFNIITQLMIYAQSVNHMYLFSLGTLFGLVLGYGLTQNMGKRKIIMLSDIIFIFGIASSFITYSYYMICSTILGFSVSLSLFTILLDIKEFVPRSSYLAQHMSIYQMYFCLGLLVSELTQINLNNAYNESSSTFDVDSFGSGQLVFLIITMSLVFLRFVLMATVFRISTPFEIIRFHQPKQNFVSNVHKLYIVADEKSARLQVIKKFNHTYVQPEHISNKRFWREALEGFLLNFFVQASGCQIFINSQQISIDNDNLQDLSEWLLLVLGSCGFVGSIIGYFLVNRYTRIRWAQVGLISTLICQGALAAFTKYQVNTFGIFCCFHFAISLCFLPAIYSFCAQKFLERGLLICHLGLWLGFFVSFIVFYYGFLQQSEFSPTSFIIFGAIAFVGLIFISFYGEEPDHCLYLDAHKNDVNQDKPDYCDDDDENNDGNKNENNNQE